MIDFNKISATARNLDAIAREGVGLKEIIARMDIDAADVHQVAEARALIILLAMRDDGGESYRKMQEAYFADERIYFPLNEAEEEQLRHLAVAWIDGFTISRRLS